MSEDFEPADPRRMLRILAQELDEELPDEEEAQIVVDRLGIDVEALTARLFAEDAARRAPLPASAPAAPPPAPAPAAPAAVPVKPRRSRVRIAAMAALAAV